MAQTVLTDQGFVRPTMAEIMQKIGDRMVESVGPVNRQADSGVGQIIAIVSEAFGVSYEAAEELFNSRFLSRASGVALDALGEWLGIPRRGKSNTTSAVILYGVNGAPVPAGARVAYGNYQFTLDAQVTISTTNTTDTTWSVNANPTGSVGLVVNGIEYVTPSSGKSQAQIAADVAALITTGGSTTQLFKATSSGVNVIVTSPNLNTGISVANRQGMSLVQVGSPGSVTAVDAGPIAVPAHNLTTMISSASGWQSVDNPVDAVPGSNRESDTDYRARLQGSNGAALGKATPGAITQAVKSVAGVTAATVVVNSTMSTVSGQPPKSFNVVVAGGLETSIGEAIYDVGGAGIETYGTEQVTIYDPDGDPHVIRFSRQVVVQYKVTVNITKLQPEEALDPRTPQLIEAAVRSYFAGLSLGDDIVVQRMVGPIYAATTGIATVTIQVYDLNNVLQPSDIVPVPQNSTAAVTSVTTTGV
jgi:uncharacterized phage protein gp47/JayE